MTASIATYFGAEKAESCLFVAAGLLALGASIFLFVSGSQWKGMAIPLVLIGLIQIAVGGGILLRTDGQLAQLQALHAQSPAAFRAAEVPRMEKVQRNFELYKIAEIALLALGIALSYFFKKNVFVYGLAIGLILQPAVMLVADLFAEARGATYLEQVRAISPL